MGTEVCSLCRQAQGGEAGRAAPLESGEGVKCELRCVVNVNTCIITPVYKNYNSFLCPEAETTVVPDVAARKHEAPPEAVTSIEFCVLE